MNERIKFYKIQFLCSLPASVTSPLLLKVFYMYFKSWGSRLLQAIYIVISIKVHVIASIAKESTIMCAIHCCHTSLHIEGRSSRACQTRHRGTLSTSPAVFTAIRCWNSDLFAHLHILHCSFWIWHLKFLGLCHLRPRMRHLKIL